MSTTDDVISSIDHTLNDFDTSDDAMRWTPEHAPPVERHRPLVFVDSDGMIASRPRVMALAITADAARFQEAMAEAASRMERTLRPLLVKIAELGPVIAELQRQEQAARLSQMHAAYRARTRRRTRSRR